MILRKFSKNRQLRQYFVRLWHHYAVGHRKYIFAAIPMAILVGIANTGQAYLFQPAIDNAIIAGDNFYIWAIPLAFLLIGLLRGILVYGLSVVIASAAERIVVALQSDLFQKLLRMDMAFFHDQGETPQIGRFITDVRYIREGAVQAFTALPKEIFSMFGMIGLMAYHSLLLTTVIIVVIPLSVVPIYYVGRKLRQISMQTQQHAGVLTSVLDQALGGVRQIKIANQYAAEAKRADMVFQRLRQLMVKIASYSQILTPFNELIKAFCFGFTVILGGYMVQQGSMTVGGLTSFLMAMIGLFSPIRVLMKMNGVMEMAAAGMERTFALLDQQPGIVDAADAVDLCVSQGEIKLKNVYFAYNSSQSVLQNCSLVIPGGQTTALVGVSGAGKSSILALIARFYDPDKGMVSIDGQDIRQVKQSSLHDSMAYISQEIELFNLSLRDNIAFACPQASFEDIQKALQQVGLWSFVDRLPDRLETMIGESGTRLSGGQRQRIAFARALLSQARIVLMDEATSALDSGSEKCIQQAMKYFPPQSTIVIVAHRLSTIVDADQICVVDQGQVVETGKHTDLLAAGGNYARLYQQQFTEKAQPLAEASD